MVEPAPRWAVHEPRFAGDIADPERASSPWSGHRWFAYDLVRWMQPGRIVELGTHYGCSFFAFLQAVQEGDLATSSHAVDTWRGDPHAGYYGEEVFDRFTSVLRGWFSEVDVTLHRGTFDAALSDFEDASIDLLHIDGYHSYEAAKHDFSTWLPKVARHGIVLMHDVGSTSGYGSTDFFDEEIVPRYPSFRFEHNFGLGVVLPKGTQGREYLFSEEFERWRTYYTHRAGHFLGELRYVDTTRMIHERDELIEHQEELLADREAALVAQQRLVEERDEALLAQNELIREREEALASQARMIDDRDRAITSQARLIDERDELIRKQDAIIASRTEAIAALEQRVARIVSELRSYDEFFLGAPERPVAAGSAAGRSDDGTPHGTPAASGTAEPDEHVRDPHNEDGARIARVLDLTPAVFHPVVRRAQREVWGFRERLGATFRDRRIRRTLEEVPLRGFDTEFYRRFNDDVPFDDRVPPAFHYVDSGVLEARPTSSTVLVELFPRLSETVPEVDEPVAGMLHVPGAAPRTIRSIHELSLSDYDLVTFDLWDTLIERTRPPEAAKLDTAAFLASVLGEDRWQIYLRRVEAEAEIAQRGSSDAGPGEYQIREVLQEALAPFDQDVDDDLVDSAAEYEVEREGRFSDVRNEIAPWFRQVIRSGCRTAVVSDFYLGAEDLRRIATAAGLELGDVEVVSSSDLGISKLSGGRLHRYVRQRFGVEPHRHLHIGDNRLSDVERQVSSGAPAVLLPRGPNHGRFPSPGVLEPASVARSVVAFIDRERPLGTFERPTTPRRWSDWEQSWPTAAFDAGAWFSVVPTSLVMGAIAFARDVGVDRVHYLSREGALLSKVHRAVLESQPDLEVAGRHLQISRRSAFLPSFGEVGHEELRLVWSTYRWQTPSQLLATLGVEAHLARPALERLGVSPDAPSRDAELHEILLEPPIQNLVETVRRVQRSRLAEYLVSAIGRDEVVVVADIGWRGTIQDCIARILPDRFVHGVYLGSFRTRNPVVANTDKRSIAFDGNVGDDVASFEANVGIIERLLSDVSPSTTGYGRREDGSIEPILSALGTIPDTTLRELTQFHEGIVATAPTVAAVIDRFGCHPRDLRGPVRERLERVLADPPPVFARLALGLPHEEDFGNIATRSPLDIEHVVGHTLRAARSGQPPPTFEGHEWPSGIRRHPTVLTAVRTFWSDS